MTVGFNMNNKAPRFFSPWFYLSLIFFTYVLAGLNTYRLQPILPRIMETLKIDTAQAGLLVSSATFLNIFITLPVGLAVSKIGVRAAGLWCLFFLLAGSAVGSFFNGYSGIMIAQSVAGLGNVLIAVSGPVFINLLFADGRLPIAMGIFTSSLTTAQFISFIVLPRITGVDKIGPAWWISFGLVIFALLCWIIFIPGVLIAHLIKKQTAHHVTEETHDNSTGFYIKKSLKNISIWQLASGLFFFMLSAIGVLSYLPSYLVVERGMDLSGASLICGFNAAVGFFCAILAGFLADKLKTCKWIYLTAVIIMAGLRILQPLVPAGFFLVLITVIQGIPAAGTGMVFSAVTSVISHPKEKSIGVSIVTTGFLCGTAISPLLFGFLVRSLGYTTSFFMMVPVAFLGLIGMFAAKGVK
jgi:ACS family glucarate transporter-like MFS transporter